MYIANFDKEEAVNILNNSDLGIYFRDIYSCVNNKWYRDSWIEFKELQGIDGKYYCSDFCDAKLNCYGVEVGTSLRFWGNKGWINEIDPYGWFQ